jgi:hypothetical protein
MDPTESALTVLARFASEEVLDALDLLYPERTPELDETLDKIRYAAGQRSVVRFLRSLNHASAGLPNLV